MIATIFRDITNLYHQHLFSKDGEQARNYLSDRGLNDETCKKFKIGYCSNNIGLEYCSKQYTDAQIKQSQLFKFGKDFFNGRIVFPLIQGNETLYFTSRSLNKKAPHLHMAGPIPIPYNVNSIDKDPLIIVESPIDCLTLEQCGYNSIAALGIYGLKNEFIKQITAKGVYIAYDYDPNDSGAVGASRIAELLMKHSILAHIVSWPSGGTKMDVNAFYRVHSNGSFIGCFNELLNMAIPYTKTLEFRNSEIQNHKKKRGSFYGLVKKYGWHVEGSNRVKILCPFHRDNKPSLVIYLDTNSAHCFGCGKHPSAIELEKKL